MTGKRRAGRSTPPAAPTSAQALVVAPRQTRRQQREQRRRERRRRVGGLGLVAIVLAVAVVGGAVGFGVHRATSSSKPPSRVQSTVLLALQAADGSAPVSALLAHDTKTGQGLELLVPSRLLTTVCGFGSQQFGQILSLPGGPRLMQTTLSQTLGGVAVDGTAVVTQQQLSRLVDAVGGISVDVDADVIVRGAGGTQTVVVPAGRQHLDGARAVQYATYVASGDDPTADLSRFQAVLQAALDALPRKASAAGRLLTSAGWPARVGGVGLAELLTNLAADDVASPPTLLPIELPTQLIDTGGGSPSYRLNQQKTTQLVSAQLADSWPASARGHRTSVLVENGIGTPGLVQTACDQLVGAGFAIAGSGNAPSFTKGSSQVIVFDSTLAGARLGARVARALRLPTDDVVASSQGQNVADVIVVLGRDYRR